MDLKQIREKKLLTQQQLANMVSVDRTLISKIESGAATPSVSYCKEKNKRVLDKRIYSDPRACFSWI